MMVVHRWVVARKSSRVDQEIQSLGGVLAKPHVELAGEVQDPGRAGVEDISAGTPFTFIKFKRPMSVLQTGRRGKM
jgi:hypothetical protein